MSTPLSKEQRSAIMASIRSKDTGPEMTLRRALWARGFRYRVNVRSLPGTPDIVLPKYRSVIFVNGCFWHAHEGCSKYSRPKTNTEFWSGKIKNNRRRDAEVSAHLQGLGWSVITVWECETEKGRLEKTLDTVADKLRENRFLYLSEKSRRREQRERDRQLSKEKRLREEALKASLAPSLHISSRARALSRNEEDSI